MNKVMNNISHEEMTYNVKREKENEYNAGSGRNVKIFIFMFH
jgi:hypothetical protein